MLSAYLSHPIRGAKGSAATREDMAANNHAAMEFAAVLRAEFPALDLYVPAEHDEFVLLAYENGYLGESDVLAVDKLLLATRDILIVYAPHGHVSKGMRVELEEALRLGISLCLTEGSFDPVRRLLESLV